MKSLVVNAHFLKLEPDKMAVLENRAALHRRYSSIEFKVLECKEGRVVVRVVQQKSHAGNYFDQKRLVEIVRETFGDLGAWSEVLARPIPYQPSPPEVVDSSWIKKKMEERGMNIKEMSHHLGVDANTLSAYKNGVKPLSGVVRAMYFYYFEMLQFRHSLQVLVQDAENAWDIEHYENQESLYAAKKLITDALPG